MQLGTRSLTLSIGGVERAAEVGDCRIVAEPIPDGERRLFEPSTRYRLVASAVQDPAAGTVWDLAWDYVGTEVEVVIRPTGNVAASADEPWFTGTVEVGEPTGDLLGGQADASRTRRLSFEIDWLFTAKPERVVA